MYLNHGMKTQDGKFVLLSEDELKKNIFFWITHLLPLLLINGAGISLFVINIVG